MTLVENDDEKQRAAAKCDRYGEIGVVQILPDGSLQPLGQSSVCDCDSATLHVLETDSDLSES
ncbi:hypothetical protein [Natronorubrum aibiense]|uniref:hypothetical protein n=1 Tax=Natronorubrum aibiense TaxID=348826 RepID=UPI001878348C|nr:hypothetical protein [Natronorubrum aibiense]